MTAEAATTQESDAAAIEVVKMRGARKLTSQRMRASLNETAQVTLTRYADASQLIALRTKLKSRVVEGVPSPTINDLVLYCVARVLTRHPEINARLRPEGLIERHSTVNLGFAVDTGRALLVPVIHEANRLTPTQLAQKSKELIALAKSGKITTEAMTGGTFTVSNLGGLGIHWFTPVLNTPEVGILGVGSTHASYPGGPLQLPLSLTFDHQCLDGAAAAAVLGSIAETFKDVRSLVAE